MLSAPVTDLPSLVARRRKWADSLTGSGVEFAILGSGWARARNFSHNLYPFRAESHFLYLVRENIEGAVLAFERGEVTLYVSRQSPEMDLWTGPEPGLEELSENLGLPVRTYDELALPPHTAVLPGQDEESCAFLSSLIEREVVPQSGPELTGSDASLAEVMVGLRLVHDAAALAQLRYAAEIGGAAHRAGIGGTSGCSHEFQVRALMEAEFLRNGLGTSYQPIVSQRGEILHNHSSADLLRPGELLLCDVGCETAEGFASDITRTFPTTGSFSASQREIYEIVLSVQRRAIEEARAGASYRELHRRSCLNMAEGLRAIGLLRGSAELLVETGAVATFYPHGLGHLLGLDVHDMEDLGDRAGYAPGRERSDHPCFRALRLDRELQAGMVVTIEPGFYRSPLLLQRAREDASVRDLIQWSVLEKYADVSGIRIEDDVLVADEGGVVLSASAPKSIDDLETLMRVSRS